MNGSLVTRAARRLYSVASNGNVGKILKDKKEIESLINTPVWNVSELIDKTMNRSDVEVDDKVVSNMLKVSGLESDISKEEKDEIKTALRRQIGMISHVYEFSQTDTASTDVFRLIASDHRKPARITLDQLGKEIKDKESNIDASKGEISNSIENDTLNLKNSYFTIKLE